MGLNFFGVVTASLEVELFRFNMAAPPKHYPKDAQVIVSIMKDMGITDYEPKVIAQLLEFTYRYVTGILDDSRVFANHAKKRTIDLEDVKLAVEMTTDRIFTTPPPRDILLDVARSKNNIPLPFVKPHCGLRLPPDRYCLSACNYRLKGDLKEPPLKQSSSISNSLSNTSSYMNNSITTSVAGSANLKLSSKSQGQGMSIVKRQTTLATVSRTQTITVPKPVIKFSSGPTSVPGATPPQVPKPVVKPKIQISSAPTQSTSSGSSMGPVPSIAIHMDTEDSLSGSNKRKREDEEDYDLID